MCAVGCRAGDGECCGGGGIGSDAGSSLTQTVDTEAVETDANAEDDVVGDEIVDDANPAEDVDVEVTDTDVESTEELTVDDGGAATYSAEPADGSEDNGDGSNDVETYSDNPVAQIGEAQYATLEDALDAAADSDETTVTIKMLQSYTITKSITIPEDKTFVLTADADDNITITDTGRYGMRPNGSLTMENMTFITNGQIALNGTTTGGPFGRVVTLHNVTLQMDGEMHQFNSDGYYCAAIFADSPATFIFDASTVDIKNYPSTGSAIRWNGKNGDRGYGVEMINGTTFTATNCYSGFVGTLDMLIDGSTVNVLNNRGNGSNGTYYTITNGSDVTFDGNGTWGISAYTITMDENSTLVATDNGYSGVWTRILNVDSSCTLDVEDNGYTGSFTGVAASTSAASNAGISFYGNGSITSEIEEGADVTVTGNAGPGIATLQGVANLTIGSATITNNGSGDADGDHSAVYGGGLYNIGTVSLGDDVVLYNNHASIAGDDIYFAPTSTARILTFGVVGSGWSLDGYPDCEHAIDGWYDDSIEVFETDEATGETVTMGGRWNAEIGGEPCSDDENHYVKEYTEFDEGNRATVTGSDLTDKETGELGTFALKAAHGEDTVELVLAGSKVLDGRAMEEGEFSFMLKDVDDVEIQTVTNAADGGFSFDAIPYDISAVGKTYTYTVSEVVPEDDDPDTTGVQGRNVTYDTEPVTVTVDVKLVGGELVREVSYVKAGEQVDGIVFTNTYVAPAEPEEPVGEETPTEEETPTDTTGTTAEDEGDAIAKTGASLIVPAVVVVLLLAVAAAGMVLRRRANR